MATKKHDKKAPPDPRSEVLSLLDKVEESAAAGLHKDDADNDAMVQAARRAKRIIENSWADQRLPEYKVRVFWATSDAVVRATGPESAKDVALALLQRPVPTRIQVMKEDPSRAWEIVADYGKVE